ncbi:glucosaminidase domain-containing protein [Patescibacteria group bacterium]|nr:glucosaminidase domain-containing protein [Patescibacteria group bacterium]
MQKTLLKFAQGLAFIPILTATSPFAMLYSGLNIPWQDNLVSVSVSLDKERADKIDAYFAKREMPLEGYGSKMVAEAEKNDIDWRLLPAIAIKESTGGKFACGYNPFGWGSCRIKFKSWDHAIEMLAYNLGGNNPTTARYYEGATTEEKLHHYNGSVIPAYTGEVLEFMELIDRGV